MKGPEAQEVLKRFSFIHSFIQSVTQQTFSVLMFEAPGWGPGIWRGRLRIVLDVNLYDLGDSNHHDRWTAQTSGQEPYPGAVHLPQVPSVGHMTFLTLADKGND